MKFKTIAILLLVVFAASLAAAPVFAADRCVVCPAETKCVCVRVCPDKCISNPIQGTLNAVGTMFGGCKLDDCPKACPTACPDPCPKDESLLTAPVRYPYAAAEGLINGIFGVCP